MTLAERIAELIEQHGSLRAAARVLECDPGYLSRLQSGEKDSPEEWLLRRMKLRRVVTYERTAGVQASQPLPGVETLRNVIACLRADARYVDEEGEATDRLQDLLDALRTDGVTVAPHQTFPHQTLMPVEDEPK